mgnify:CR=1 FL=1
MSETHCRTCTCGMMTAPPLVGPPYFPDFFLCSVCKQLVPYPGHQCRSVYDHNNITAGKDWMLPSP